MTDVHLTHALNTWASPGRSRHSTSGCRHKGRQAAQRCTHVAGACRQLYSDWAGRLTATALLCTGWPGEKAKSPKICKRLLQAHPLDALLPHHMVIQTLQDLLGSQDGPTTEAHSIGRVAAGAAILWHSVEGLVLKLRVLQGRGTGSCTDVTAWSCAKHVYHSASESSAAAPLTADTCATYNYTCTQVSSYTQTREA